MCATAIRTYTPDDLLTLPDGKSYELVHGNLVARNMGAESSYVAGEIYHRIRAYTAERQLGWVFPEGTSYRCFLETGDNVRRPDVSFVRFGRFPNEQLPKGHIRIAPDLAVEVLSPHDLMEEVDEKVEEYLAAGVPVVWIVSPATRTVRVHRREERDLIRLLREADEPTVEEVLPGFRCQVQELFALPVKEA